MARGKYVVCTGKPIGSLEDALSDIEALKEEIEEWRDNLESNSMDHLPKYEEVSEAADNLDSAWGEIEDAKRELEEALEGKPACDHRPERFKKKANQQGRFRSLARRCPRCRWDGTGNEPEAKEAVEPLFDDDELQDVSWSEFRKYGKRALNLSRNDRMGNAVACAMACVEALYEIVEVGDGDDDKQELREALDNLKGGIEAAGMTDFPGMY